MNVRTASDNGICSCGGEMDYDEACVNAALIAQAPAMYAAMQEFCDRVDRGEVRSRRTYEQFKSILAAARGGNSVAFREKTETVTAVYAGAGCGRRLAEVDRITTVNSFRENNDPTEPSQEELNQLNPNAEPPEHEPITDCQFFYCSLNSGRGHCCSTLDKKDQCTFIPDQFNEDL